MYKYYTTRNSEHTLGVSWWGFRRGLSRLEKLDNKKDILYSFYIIIFLFKKEFHFSWHRNED